MLINLRNALMAGKRLPYDAEVEYLQSDGSQFIKVPGKISSTSRITVTFKYTGATFSQFAPFGGGDGNLAREASLISDASSTGSWIYRCNNRQNLNVVNLDISQVHTVTWYKDGAVLDGVDYPSLTTTSNFTPTRDYFGLFANLRNGDNSPIFTMRGYIMSAQVYDNGVLVRDFVPVRKGTVGYLYDRVSGALFGNAGTGDFVLGPDVVPVEYILQTGTQYIDTLYPMADTRREVITVDWSGHSTTYREFMAGAASGSYLIEMSPTGYYGTAYNHYSSIHVSTKDKIRWDYTVGVKPYLYINDVFAIQDSLLRVPTGNIKTGGIGTSGVNYPKMKIYGLDIFTDADEQVRKMLPIRVGTEGAMMDVLTRRIYRNAGTGAFTYGNDLKYPIPA